MVCGEKKAKPTAKYCISCSFEIDVERRDLYKIANKKAVDNVKSRKVQNNSEVVQLNDGDRFKIECSGETLNFECCDCGLRHKFTFKTEENQEKIVTVERL